MDEIEIQIERWKHCANDDGLVRKWSNIARVLEVSEKTARRISEAGIADRVPVFFDHIGPLATLRALAKWKVRRRVPVGHHHPKDPTAA